jgi:hypothetical protein
MDTPNQRARSKWFLVLLLLLLPFACAATAFAARLSIESPYFTIRFGPPLVEDTGDGDPSTGGPVTTLPPVASLPGPVSDDLSGGGGGDDRGGGDGGGGGGGATSASDQCFLGFVCVSASADSGDTATGASVESDGVDVEENSNQENGDSGDLNLDLGVDNNDSEGVDITLDGPEDTDTDATVGGSDVINVEPPPAVEDLLNLP